MTIKYLSVTDVSKRLGISTAAVSAYKLPQPDALIGRTRGWLPDTIDQWNAQRPGRGVGGGRPPRRSSASAGAVLLLEVGCCQSWIDGWHCAVFRYLIETTWWIWVPGIFSLAAFPLRRDCG